MADRRRDLGARRDPWRGKPLLRSIALLLLLALPLLPTPLPLSPAAAEESETAPDFSAVTTTRAARKLVREGRLVEIRFFPEEFGGPDDPENTGYITPEAADARSAAIATLSDQLDRGVIDQMMVSPDYKGDSIVPSRITMFARHHAEEGVVELTIEVW